MKITNSTILLKAVQIIPFVTSGTEDDIYIHIFHRGICAMSLFIAGVLCKFTELRLITDERENIKCTLLPVRSQY